MKKWKKSVTGLLVATMVFTAGQMVAFAEEIDNQEVLPVEAGVEESYGLKVAGVQVTSENAADILGDGTASYDAVTKTLTLNGVDIYVEKGNYGIRAEGEIILNVVGENKIHSEDYYGIVFVPTTDGVNPVAEICGTGSLESYGADEGIWSKKGSLKISGDVTVKATCGVVTSGDAYGICVDGPFTICGNANVTAIANAAPVNSYGIKCSDRLVVCENAKVVAEGGNGVERSAGIYVINQIDVKDQAVVEAKGYDNSEAGNYASESYGIRTTDLYVHGGELHTTAQGATGMSAGVYAQNVGVTGGTFSTQSINPKEAQSVGIQATKTLTVSGGTLNAAGADTTADSCGIDASGTFTVSGGVVNAVAGNGDRAGAIYTDIMEISGGVITAEAYDAIRQSRGIQAINSFVISGGEVNAKSGNAESQSYAMQTGGVLNITGGQINAVSGSAQKSSALYAADTIKIADASVSVISQGIGINAPYGNVEFASTEVTLSEDKTAVEGTRVRISAADKVVGAMNDIMIDEKLSYLVDDSGKEAEIVPLSYNVTINGFENEIKVLLPAGKTVNEVYPELYASLDTEREGYTFKGFGEFTFDTVVTADMTVTVVWEEVVTEVPDVPSDRPGAVQTGDTSNVMIWCVLMLGAAVISKKKIEEL